MEDRVKMNTKRVSPRTVFDFAIWLKLPAWKSGREAERCGYLEKVRRTGRATLTMMMVPSIIVGS
jgi:hypothetical protein